MSPPSPDVAANLRWGLGWGAAMACGVSLIAVGVALVQGSTTFDDRRGLSLGEVLLAYWASAGLGGAVLGLARPLLRFPVGAILTGWLIGAITYGSVAAMFVASWREVLGFSVVLGLIGAFIAFREWEREFDA